MAAKEKEKGERGNKVGNGAGKGEGVSLERQENNGTFIQLLEARAISLSPISK